MSTPEPDHARKLALLEARLIAQSASEASNSPAGPAAAGMSAGGGLASDSSSLGSVDSLPDGQQPVVPAPRSANQHRNYAPSPASKADVREPAARADSKPLPSPTRDPRQQQGRADPLRPPPLPPADSSNHSKSGRGRPASATVPRKRRRTGAGASSPSNLRNSRVDSYFKPKSRETSKDCPPRAARRSNPPPPPAAAAAANAFFSAAAPTPNGKPATPAPEPAQPSGQLLHSAVQRSLSFNSPRAATSRGASPAGSATGSGGEDPSQTGTTATGADDYRRLREMIDRLQAENASLAGADARAKKLEAENEDLSATLEIELPMLREQASAAAAEHERSRARLQVLGGALRDAVVAAARSERADARRRVAAMGDRVGRLGVERSRTQLQEVWEEGTEWKEISSKLRAVAAEREAIDKRRRELARAKASQLKAEAARAKAAGDASAGDMPPPPTPGIPTGTPYVQTPVYIAEQEEIYRVQLQVLKREEAALGDQRVRLNRERDVLVRELRRQSDEDLSAFNGFPVINSRYVALNLLGRGGFSEVFKGFDLEQGRPVACKIHQLASNWSEEKKRTFIRHSMREYEIHKSLRHPRVVQLIDIFEIDENTFCTVLEYCDGSDLDSYLRAHHTLPEREARSIIGQVISGLVYLSEQQKRIIHYDLKPGNILLHKGEARIADFGLSKIMGDSDATADGMELTSQGAGTMWYLPPECFETATQARISSKVDVWSTGVILFQMLYGRKPFGHDQTQEKMFREKTVARQELKFPAKPQVSEAAKGFITRCLTRKAAERPAVAELVLHPFLRRR